MVEYDPTGQKRLKLAMEARNRRRVEEECEAIVGNPMGALDFDHDDDPTPRVRWWQTAVFFAICFVAAGFLGAFLSWIGLFSLNTSNWWAEL